jgi:putative protein kinase ArgK-like GTPase of G3E family
MAKIAPALAKLSYPKLHRPIQRTRLFALLQERSHHPLLWITGSPGAGKTTLVATFLQRASFGRSGTKSTPATPTSRRFSITSAKPQG